MNANDIIPLIDIALGIAKDKAFLDALERVKNAQREYLIAESNANKKKTGEIINEINRLDISVVKLKHEYSRIKPHLTDDACEHFRSLFKSLQTQRERLLSDKNNTGRSVASNDPAKEHIYGAELNAGDILAVTRKAGLYQHFAVYIGEYRVIHYAAENGDFSGKITIHEAPFSEFKSDSTFVYVLKFPDSSGYPADYNMIRKGILPEPPLNEAPFFDLIRQSGYNLFSPEETVERAKSRLGEDKYSLPFNNCEHFALWCKTGVSESHQVNVWLTRLAKYARRYI